MKPILHRLTYSVDQNIGEVNSLLKRAGEAGQLVKSSLLVKLVSW